MRRIRVKVLVDFRAFKSAKDAIAFSQTRVAERRDAGERDHQLLKQAKVSIVEVVWNDVTVLLRLSNDTDLVLECVGRSVEWRLVERDTVHFAPHAADDVCMLESTMQIAGEARTSEYRYDRARFAREMVGKSIVQFSPTACGVDVWLPGFVIVMFWPARNEDDGSPFLKWSFA